MPASTTPGNRVEQIFPWTRFWVPLDSRIHMGGLWDEAEGFLADPEDGFIGKHSNKHLRPTPQLLAKQADCLVLCGEPGMGKSQTLRSFLKSAPTTNTLAVEFRDVPDSGRFERMTLNSATWMAWRNRTDILTFVIDGVDEGLIKIAGFVDYLTGLLRSEPVQRLQLILACRSLEWPLSEGQRLIDLWTTRTQSGVYELCPLRDCDARMAAETVLSGKARLTANGFMRSVREHQLIGLATRPLTLKMLLHEFGEGGRFSRSHRELYRRYSHFLCGEHDTARGRRLRDQSAPRLQVSQATRERLAGRIAALLLLSGRSAIWPGKSDEAAPSDLTIAEISEGAEHVAGVDFAVMPPMVEAVLESPLFWPKEQGRVGFYHQTFAESLAAEYLREIPFPQIRSLLCRRDRRGEFVHPPLAELAAWLATESEPLRSHLLVHDPETLLRSDVSAIKEDHRAALVDAVLAKAAAGELFDTRGLERFFHTLAHSKLAAQLRPIIHDRSKNHVTRRIAFHIAEACKLTALFGDALARLCDRRDTGIHSLAASAMDDLVDARSAPKLARFITHKRKHPLPAGVQLSLLHALLNHGYWSLGQALPYAEAALPRRDTSAYILAQHARAEDADPLLRACLRWKGCFDSLGRYHALVCKAHEFGLARIDEPPIRRLMARVWWRARLKYRHDGFTSGREQAAPNLHQRLQQDTALRHRFIDDIVSLPSTWVKKRWWFLHELIIADDFPRLFDRALIGSPKRRRVYAHLAARTHDPERHTYYWDELLVGLSRSPELREAFAWLRLWPLDAEETQQQKKQYYEALQSRENANLRRPTKRMADPIAVWKRDLDYLPRGKPEHWLTLAHNLFYRGDAKKEDDETRYDVRTSPGWEYHSEPAHAQIVAGAHRFLLEVPGNPQHPVGGNSEFDELAYKALYLLRKDIEQFRELAEAVRRCWLPTIFDEFSNADEHHLEMVALGYRLDPAAMRALLKARIIYDAGREQGYCLQLREFAQCWDRPLADFIVTICADEVTNSVTAGCIAEYLAEHDPQAAHDLWTKLGAIHSTNTQRYLVVTAALANWRLFDLWDEIWPTLTSDSDFARRVFLAFDRHDQRNFLQRAQPFPKFRLAELYLYLRKLFPPQEDPPTPVGRSFTPTRRMEIARLRDELPAILAAMSTDTAADELLRISNLLPPEEGLWIRWKWRETVVAVRRKAWQPPRPKLVLALVWKANRRLLTDEDDLLALVLESLERLGSNLTSQPNSQRRDYWQLRRGRNGVKYFSPCDEVEMSRRITTWLQSDLAISRGITVQREVQVQWNKRTDIEVRAVAVQGENIRPLEIVIEVKGCWHPRVLSAHADQLVGDYLKRSGKTHGIYLVIWTVCAAWNDPTDKRRSRLKSKTLRGARDEVTALVSGYNGITSPAVVSAIVLDARL